MDVYAALEYPPASEDRPYVFINMVATIDGKTVTGSRDEDVTGLGSRVDYLLMTRIEASADAVLVGARTLRATSPSWNPRAGTRIVISRSGQVPEDARFLTAGRAYIAMPEDAAGSAPTKADVLTFADLPGLLRRLRTELAVNRLVVMGGSELNGQLLQMDLVDELFLTVAPKIKLGRDTPTYAGGIALPRDQMLDFQLAEHHVIGDEVFLRYRRNKH